ncbi:MAG: hypothetical protein MRZ79_04560 [Bacteroidia bacterium]|nr:hypothetical protein [Bacteroidia bacterium]
MKLYILVLAIFTSIVINACVPSEENTASSSIQDINSGVGDDEPEYLDSAFYPQSFFQEFFQKERLEIGDQSFVLSIPFDLHDRGGLSPDCYITELNLTFSSEAPFSFPVKLPFVEKEHGCVDKESKISGHLILAEDNDTYVQYHSLEPSRLLLLFKNGHNGSLAYLFSEGDMRGISGKNFDFILKKFESLELEDRYPARSSLLMTEN